MRALAFDAAAHLTRSPWWYRNRLFTIGAVYFVAFFFGALVSGLVGRDPEPIFLQVRDGSRHGVSDALLVFAIVATVCCWALRFWGAAYLRPDVVWHADALDDRLIVEGPFRYVRNPLYLGNEVQAIGMAIFATPLGAFMIIAGNFALFSGLVHVEQRALRARYGAAFDAYAEAVPAIFPRLTPLAATAAPATQPSYRSAFRSEIFSLAFVLPVVALAVYFW